VAWVIARANESVGTYFGTLQAQELLAWFGVHGAVSQRAEVFLKAIGGTCTTSSDRSISVLRTCSSRGVAPGSSSRGTATSKSHKSVRYDDGCCDRP
jgi:hypothetical protein